MQVATLRAKYAALVPVLTERSCRVWAATEARAIGYGGIAVVARATGIAESTIQRGLGDLDAREPLAASRSRRPGGGRKRATETDSTLLRDLDALVEPTAPGDPESPTPLDEQERADVGGGPGGTGTSRQPHGRRRALHALGYSLRSNVKTREGRQHPDRDAQFRYIAQAVRRWQRRGQPTIAVDTKKELVGDFKNGGRTWRPLKTPHGVRVHDFVMPATATRGGKAIPYGVYDLQRDEGWVSVGIDHDTASFAVHTIRRWWRVMGRPAYRRARSLLMTADAGGSNGARLRLWKWELQRLANRTGLAITVCHFPPGTSKWNKIEHRLFSYIAMNWRGTPLVNVATIVSLIGATRSRSGLRIRSELDRGRYPSGVTVTDAQLANVCLERHRFHGDWNYTIHPADMTHRHRVLIP